jgi:hypothetical protein
VIYTWALIHGVLVASFDYPKTLEVMPNIYVILQCIWIN